MADEGHVETEKLLKDLEKRIAKEYAQAEKEVQEKLDDYLRRFRLKDQKWREWVAEGKKTKEEYAQWKVGQIMIGKRWEALKDQLAQDLHSANAIARGVIQNGMLDVYAINHNFGTYQIEHGLSISTSYTLYSRETVERILKDNPDLLPPPGIRMKQTFSDFEKYKKGENVELKKDTQDAFDKLITKNKDIRWQKGKIQSVTLQSILQGESITNMSKRIAREMGEVNHKSTIRYARTAATGAQNAGRVDAYGRAQKMGIEVRQTWLATLDNRTRHSHRQLDGETVDIGGMFSNGCHYPGDPTGPASEVYNCRCTLIGQIKGFERDVRGFGLRNDPNIGGMTYEQWRNEKRSTSNKITLPEEKGESIRMKYIREYRRK